MTLIGKIRRRAGAMKRQVTVLQFASQDPRTPRLAKFIVLAVIAYALSPIDLVPDFIPVLGLLDDLVLVPLGIFIAIKLIPPGVMNDARTRASATPPPGSRAGAKWAVMAVIVAIWIVVAASLIFWLPT